MKEAILELTKIVKQLREAHRKAKLLSKSKTDLKGVLMPLQRKIGEAIGEAKHAIGTAVVDSTEEDQA